MSSSCWLSSGASPDLSSIRAHCTHSRHLGRRCSAIPDDARAMQPHPNSGLVSYYHSQPGCTKVTTLTGRSSGSRRMFAMDGDLPWRKSCRRPFSLWCALPAHHVEQPPREQFENTCQYWWQLHVDWTLFLHVHDNASNRTGRWALLLPFWPSGLQANLDSGIDVTHDLHDGNCMSNGFLFCMCMTMHATGTATW